MSKQWPYGTKWNEELRKAMQKTGDEMRRMSTAGINASEAGEALHRVLLELNNVKPSKLQRLRTWISGITQRIRRRFTRGQGLQWVHSKQLDAILVKHQREIHGQMLVVDRPKNHPNPARIVIAAQGMLNQYGVS